MSADSYKAAVLGLLCTLTTFVLVPLLCVGTIALIFGAIRLMIVLGWIGVALLTGLILFGLFTYKINKNLRNGDEWYYTGMY